MVKHLFEAPAMPPELPKSLALPDPPKSLRRQRWLVALGIFILGVSSPFTGIVAYSSLETAQQNSETADEAIALAEANLAVSRCRADLFANVQEAEGKITALLANAITDRLAGGSDEQLQVYIEELEELTIALSAAHDRRNRVADICEEDD